MADEQNPSMDPQMPAPGLVPAAAGEVELADEPWIDLLDRVLQAQAPLARRYVERLRAERPEATERQLLELLTGRFIALTTTVGAGAGGIAALPGLGTVAAFGLTLGEGLTFAQTSAFLTLAAAEIHGVDMSDEQSRRLVLMAVLSGERGTEIIAKALGKHGLQWNAVLGGGGIVPGLISRQVGKYIRRRILARTGRVWVTRLLPFGIGAVLGGLAARAVARSVVEALHEIFSQSAQSAGGRGINPPA